MTVGMKMHQSIASCESLVADMKTFALETQDPQAKQMFNNLASTFESCASQIRGRTNYIERQEPQYKRQ